jgi:adenylate kinase
LDGNGIVTRIAAQTFLAIQPSAILVLTETPAVIAARGQTRDGIVRSESELEEFQSAEVEHAKEIAALLGVPLQLLSGATDVNNGIDFIKTNIGGNQNGR